MTNYWVVGASWDGKDLQDDRFVREGIWMLGHEDGDQHQLASQIQPKDRIAIKRMKGKGHTEIRILHLGIVMGVILDTSNVICTVDWVAKNLNRDVKSRGCFGSIHGPYEHNTWIQEVFCL